MCKNKLKPFVLIYSYDIRAKELYALHIVYNFKRGCARINKKLYLFLRYPSEGIICLLHIVLSKKLQNKTKTFNFYCFILVEKITQKCYLNVNKCRRSSVG